MTGKTTIEWATKVWNPTTGCTRVSAGCDNCYAFALHDKRFKANLDVAAARGYGADVSSVASMRPTLARRGGVKLPYPKQYDIPFSRVQLLPKRLNEPMRWTKRQRVFVDSMADLFHEDVPIKFVAEVFDTMASVRAMTRRREPELEDYTGPVHDYLILTKRPERMRQVVEELPNYVGEYFAGDAPINVMMEVGQWPLPNVWLGTSVEDQAAADERIPHLLATPAAVRFLSCEPLIAPVYLGRILGADPGRNGRVGLDWVIVGGESGPRARPMDLAWARSLVAQCRARGVAPFVKQMGSNPIERVSDDGCPTNERHDHAYRLRESHGRDMAEWPDDLRIREWPRGYAP